MFNNSDIHNLNEMSDNELIAIARERAGKDDSKAVNVLISRYLGLVWKRAYSFSGNYADTEDLSQEGLLALLKAISHFDESNGAKFSTFADVCITNRIKTVVSKLNSVSESPSLDVLDDDIETLVELSPESICLEKEFTENLYREISSLLTELEWSIFRLYLENLSYGEIADRLCISEKSVDNAVYRVRRKLKSLLSPERFRR